jgi:hypothetical protein
VADDLDRVLRSTEEFGCCCCCTPDDGFNNNFLMQPTASVHDFASWSSSGIYLFHTVNALRTECWGEYWDVEVTGGLRKLHHDDLHIMYSSPHIRMVELNSTEWTGHLKAVEEIRQSWKVLEGVPIGNRQFGRPGCRWKIWKGGRRNILAGYRPDSFDWG